MTPRQKRGIERCTHRGGRPVGGLAELRDSSVRTTRGFLDGERIARLRPEAGEALRSAEELSVVRDASDRPFPLLYMELKHNQTIMERAIAKDLLSIGAVFLRPEQPFTWASGIKSPIYCDNRLTLSVPEVRRRIEAGLAEIVRTHYAQAEALMGTSTAGIAHAAIAAMLLDLPMGYVRGGQKDHGRGNRIEGRLTPGQKVVVIEDLISTGGSCIETVEALREAGADVLGVASIFTYGMRKGVEQLAAAGVVNHSLSNLDVLVEVASDEGYIRPEDKARLIAFRNDPSDESWIGK